MFKQSYLHFPQPSCAVFRHKYQKPSALLSLFSVISVYLWHWTWSLSYGEHSLSCKVFYKTFHKIASDYHPTYHALHKTYIHYHQLILNCKSTRDFKWIYKWKFATPTRKSNWTDSCKILNRSSLLQRLNFYNWKNCSTIFRARSLLIIISDVCSARSLRSLGLHVLFHSSNLT